MVLLPARVRVGVRGARGAGSSGRSGSPGAGRTGAARRRLLLVVPLVSLVLLLALVLTVWFGGPGPGPGPGLAGVWAVLPGKLEFPLAAGAGAGAGADTDADADADIARRSSPFSFDLANASASAADWMAAAPDAWPLARLALPGTHDSLTHRLAAQPVFRCQNTGLAAQLAAGVRYVDVRARVVYPRPLLGLASLPSLPSPPPLAIYHGPVYAGDELADVVRTVFAFLDTHPAEAVVLRLKQEGPPVVGALDDPPGTVVTPAPAPGPPSSSSSSSSFAAAAAFPFFDALEHYRLRDPRTAPGFARHLFRFPADLPSPRAVPTVGALRGKVLLLREFPVPPAASVPPLGIPWQLASPLLRIEDDWQVPDLAHLDDKWAAVRASLTAAAATDDDDDDDEPSPLFLTHLSASVGVAPVDAAAGPANRSVEGINDRAGRWLRAPDSAPGPVGIVIADFPGRRLVDAILQRNAFLQS